MPPVTRRARTNGLDLSSDIGLFGSIDSDSFDNGPKHFNKAEILTCLHPLEEVHMIASDEMSFEQRMITFCMKYHGGKATEDQMIQFLTDHFEMMQDQSIQPNRRVLRSILISQINKQQLFSRCPYERQRWCLNQSEATPPPELNTYHHSGSQVKILVEHHEKTFQDSLVYLIKSSEYGLTINSIIEEAKKFSHLGGSFVHLPLERRVKASLKAKSASKEIFYDTKQMLWTSERQYKNFEETRYVSNKESLPEELEGIQMNKISVNDLYDFLKQKGIFE